MFYNHCYIFYKVFLYKRLSKYYYHFYHALILERVYVKKGLCWHYDAQRFQEWYLSYLLDYGLSIIITNILIAPFRFYCTGHYCGPSWSAHISLNENTLRDVTFLLIHEDVFCSKAFFWKSNKSLPQTCHLVH